MLDAGCWILDTRFEIAIETEEIEQKETKEAKSWVVTDNWQL